MQNKNDERDQSCDETHSLLMQNKNDESDQSCDETRSLLMQYCSRVLWLFGNDECGISRAEQTMEYHGIIKPSSRSSFFFF